MVSEQPEFFHVMQAHRGPSFLLFWFFLVATNSQPGSTNLDNINCLIYNDLRRVIAGCHVVWYAWLGLIAGCQAVVGFLVFLGKCLDVPCLLLVWIVLLILAVYDCSYSNNYYKIVYHLVYLSEILMHFFFHFFFGFLICDIIKFLSII